MAFSGTELDEHGTHFFRDSTARQIFDCSALPQSESDWHDEQVYCVSWLQNRADGSVQSEDERHSRQKDSTQNGCVEIVQSESNVHFVNEVGKTEDVVNVACAVGTGADAGSES